MGRNVLKLEMVRGCAMVLLNEAMASLIAMVGLKKKDWEILTGSKMWVGTDRAMVTKSLQTLVHGFIDTMGLPRINVPAEFVATAITIFVAPCNYYSACMFLGSYYSGSSLSALYNQDADTEGLEKVAPEKLFALCCDIAGSSIIDDAAGEFSRKSQIAIGYKIKELEEIEND